MTLKIGDQGKGFARLKNKEKQSWKWKKREM